MNTDPRSREQNARDENWNRMMGYRTFVETCPECGKQFTRSCQVGSNLTYLCCSIPKQECVIHQLIQHPLQAAKLKKLLLVILDALAALGIGLVSFVTSTILMAVDKLMGSIGSGRK